MVHKRDSEGQQPKVRGRPFTKGNKRGIPPSDDMDSKGRESSDRGEFIVLPPKSLAQEAVMQPNASVVEFDSIEFKNGESVLKIMLSKLDGRYIKMSFILNETMEVKPTTFTSLTNALSFWNMLKEKIS